MRYAVTGATGFIATQLIADLLRTGNEVIGTVRSLDRDGELRANLRALGADPEPLELRVADLNQTDSWPSALAGAEAMFHVASPLPLTPKRRDPLLVATAAEGTRNVLAGAVSAGIARVVLTSSVAAIGYGHPKDGNRNFDETHWTDENSGPGSYALSKTRAERVAWEFAGQHGLELNTVNPSVVLGPVSKSDPGTSANLVGLAIRGKIPAIPPVNFSIVDVRDVSSLHILAMLSGRTGERYIANAEEVSFAELVATLRAEHPRLKLPKVAIPLPVARLYANLDPRARAAAAELGVPRSYSSAKAREHFGWQPRSAREAILATAGSLLG
jgi:nucleoside-diphosphate-sugar epimerase